MCHIPWWKWKGRLEDEGSMGGETIYGLHLGYTEIKALLWSETLLKDSYGNLGKTAWAEASRKWGIFYEKVQISDT